MDAVSSSGDFVPKYVGTSEAAWDLMGAVGSSGDFVPEYVGTSGAAWGSVV